MVETFEPLRCNPAVARLCTAVPASGRGSVPALEIFVVMKLWALVLELMVQMFSLQPPHWCVDKPLGESNPGFKKHPMLNMAL